MLCTKGVEVAREVIGGVELISPGEVELLLPDELSFTIKSAGPFIGKAVLCYVATTTVNKVFSYHNSAGICPPGTRVLLISNERRAHGLQAERRGSVVHYQFKDFNGGMWCPRFIVNNHQNFTILRLPQAPVIVNAASLPKNKETATAAISTKIVIICVVVFLLILVAIIVGIWFYMYSKKKPTSVKEVQQSSKSRKSHCKTSPAVVSARPSTVLHSKKEIQVNSSNSANENDV